MRSCITVVSYFRGNLNAAPWIFPLSGLSLHQPWGPRASPTLPALHPGWGRAGQGLNDAGHVGCATAILPGRGGAIPNSLLSVGLDHARPRRPRVDPAPPRASGMRSSPSLQNPASTLLYVCLGHRAPSNSWAAPRGSALKKAHLHQQPQEWQPGSNKICSDVKSETASAGGLGDPQ